MTRNGPGAVSEAGAKALAKYAKGTSGEWIAREMNELADLRWDRTTVNKILNNNRALTPEELMVLPALLRAVSGNSKLTLADVLAGEIRVGKTRLRDGIAEWPGGYRPLWKRERDRIMRDHPEYFESRE